MMDKVKCEACGKMVTHVSSACEWCDDCEIAYDESLDREFDRGLAASGYFKDDEKAEDERK